MSAEIIDGRAIAKTIGAEIKAEVQQRKAQGKSIPVLAAVLVGEDAASVTYVNMKERACERAGIGSESVRLPADISEEKLLQVIDELNAREDIHGILLQHPVPAHIDERRAFDRIAVTKDVDGVTAAGFGRMALGVPTFKSCTPYGIMELLDRSGVDLLGKEAVVVGRSPILGKPVAMLLLERHATVTMCHSRTRDLGVVTRRADILVAAVGKAELITGAMIKPGAVVIDAGYNKVPGRKGDVGDVHFESAQQVAAKITPVPGGVGPMTIAMLLKNTLEAAKQQEASA